MKEQFVPYEIAILLKEKGFTDECMASYDISLTAQEDEEDGFSGSFGWEKGEVTFNKGYFANGVPYCDFSNEHWLYCAAPLWQQVIDWLLDKYMIHVSIYPIHEYWEGDLRKVDKEVNSSFYNLLEKEYKHRKEARQAAIEKALTLI
jgi:hypothetical protein